MNQYVWTPAGPLRVSAFGTIRVPGGVLIPASPIVDSGPIVGGMSLVFTPESQAKFQEYMTKAHQIITKLEENYGHIAVARFKSESHFDEVCQLYNILAAIPSNDMGQANDIMLKFRNINITYFRPTVDEYIEIVKSL